MDEFQESSVCPDDAQAESSAKPGAKPSKRRQRNKRIDQFERNGLKSADDYEACLAAMAADNIRFTFDISDRLKAGIAAGSGTVEELDQLKPALDLFLRYNKFNERLAQFRLRVVESQQRKGRNVRNPLHSPISQMADLDYGSIEKALRDGLI
jgi:hypothetical protein